MVHMNETPTPGHVMPYHRWQDFGACTALYDAANTRSQYVSLDRIFFGKTGRPKLQAAALEWCADCPVKSLCFEYSVVYDERQGVWGGFTVKQRDRFLALHPGLRKDLLKRAVDEGWLQEELLEGWALEYVNRYRKAQGQPEPTPVAIAPSFLDAQSLPESFLHTEPLLQEPLVG